MEISNTDQDTEVSKSKSKGEDNLEERGQKIVVPLFVSTDRGIATVSRELDLPQCTPALPTRLQTRLPTTDFLSSRTVRRRRLREEEKEEEVDAGVEERRRRSLRKFSRQ